MDTLYTLRKWQSNLQPVFQMLKADALNVAQSLLTITARLEPLQKQLIGVIGLTLTVITVSVIALSPTNRASGDQISIAGINKGNASKLKPTARSPKPETSKKESGVLPLVTAVLLVQDPDWQFITVQKMMALEMFVKSDSSLENFDFSNAEQVAKVLERTADQVQGTAILLQQAKERLRQRYNLPLPNECDEERLNPEERNAENRNIVAYFRNERVAFQKLKSFLLKNRLLLGQKQCHMQFEYSWWAQSEDYCYWGGAMIICS